MIDASVLPALEPLLDGLRDKMKPGLSEISWASATCVSFVRGLQVAVDEVETMLARVADLMNRQIAPKIAGIRGTKLIDLSCAPSAVEDPPAPPVKKDNNLGEAEVGKREANDALRDVDGHILLDDRRSAADKALVPRESHSVDAFVALCVEQIEAAEELMCRECMVVEEASRQMMGLVLACFDPTTQAHRRALGLLNDAMHDLEMQTYV